MIYDNLKEWFESGGVQNRGEFIKLLNNMAYKTVTSMRDCVMKRKFM